MLINLGTVLISETERKLLILLVTKSTTSTSETDVLLLIFFINYMEVIVLLCQPGKRCVHCLLNIVYLLYTFYTSVHNAVCLMSIKKIVTEPNV